MCGAWPCAELYPTKGVIHRAKPANIFMVGQAPAQVLDFGVHACARLKKLNRTTGTAVGNRGQLSMAPERVVQAPVDRRVDVYALGVVRCEMLTGKRAFSGSSLEEIARRGGEQAVPKAHEVNQRCRVPV